MMKVFYWDYYFDEGIQSDNPRICNEEFVLDLFYKLTDIEANFLGIIDKYTNTLQFMFVEQDKWLVEIPSSNNINRQMYANYDECVELIKNSFLIDEIVVSLEPV